MDQTQEPMNHKKIQIEDSTNIAQVKKYSAESERKLKSKIALFHKYQTERIFLYNRKMIELQEKNELFQINWNRLNTQKRG